MTEIECDDSDGIGSVGCCSFFRKIDWASFWTAAVISFIVYFLTAAPSVTLEDAGELAVAGDHLGVPHPPGYPIWTLCAWVFARVFSFVTFRGQPNPAWAIAILSGFFGALATGLAAMLVTRTSSDILHLHKSVRREGKLDIGDYRKPGFFERTDIVEIICWVAGVASSLVFAFSPVMWSQSTIVEVYTLNAFFLMLIFVLTYRWMCRPTDKLLFMTAFAFGLGLTNYQVLLLAIIPLVIVIMLQNIELFRDFVLVVIPFGLTAGMMKLGALNSQPGFPKHPLLDTTGDITCSAVVANHYYLSAILLMGAFIGATVYAGILAVRKSKRKLSELETMHFQVAAFLTVIFAVALFLLCTHVPAAPVPASFAGAPESAIFDWGMWVKVFVAVLTVLFVFSLFTPAGLWYAIAVAGIEIAVAIFIKRGALLGLTHPLSGAFAFYLSLNFIILAIAWLLLPFGKTVSLTVLAAELGVAFYGYMPIASETNPPMNWGYPRTWEGFKHALTRGQYEKIAPTTMFSPLFVKQLGAYFADMRMQFTLILAPFGFIPFAVWSAKVGTFRLNATKIAVFISGLVAALVVIDKLTGTTQLDVIRLDKWLIAVLLGLAFVGAHAMVVGQLVGLGRNVFNSTETQSTRLITGLSGIGIAVLVLAVALGFCNAAAESILEGFGCLEPGASEAEAVHKIYLLKDYALTGVFYLVWVSGVGALAWLITSRSERFKIELKEVEQRWQIATISCFLVMSLGLIALANPKYDIQDNFIQKVKFIASHGIFAIWIGYGLAYALVTFRRFRPFCAMLIVSVMLMPLIPIHENYRNERLVDTMGGAEQNGHDFGWQFGNYQLRGADAITEELEIDEEPLPNPEFPLAMTSDAVFYGGTDPGRFVPTYMIYSANVRPDVFLITQNALADNTYMDTMRFLYSDQLWMPTIDDNSAAFQKYVEEVQTGKRPNIGGITMDGGRVQVNGALAVMEINGIITEDIFKKNRDRHDFYVEESYAIKWMYPYLTPHGLIMKINHDLVRISAKNVADDMDFWDWYTRRLLANPRYPRDFVARKSFSKLRSSIAGLYANRRMHEQAERAFQEARALYVYSPESNLRLIQEVLLPQRRINESVAMLELLKRLDPNNERIPLNEIKELQRATDRSTTLMTKKAVSGPLTEDEILELAESSFILGLHPQAMTAISQHMESNGITARFALKTGLLLARYERHKEASQVFAAVNPSVFADMNDVADADLRKIYETHSIARNQQAVRDTLRVYLLRVQNDWKAWLDYANLCLASGDRNKAVTALDFAVKYGGHEAEAIIGQVEHLRTIYAPRHGLRRDVRIPLPESGGKR